MNYFELFELPVTLRPDKALVRKKYLELTRRHHPDYFVNNSGSEQASALDVSAVLNKALNTFNDHDATIRYVLQLKELIEEEEKYSLPPSFLMEMMEFNEAVDDLEPGDEVQGSKLLADLQAFEKELYEPVKDIVEQYQEGVTSKEELLQVKDYYFKKKYLERLYSQLKGKL